MKIKGNTTKERLEALNKFFNEMTLEKAIKLSERTGFKFDIKNGQVIGVTH